MSSTQIRCICCCCLLVMATNVDENTSSSAIPPSTASPPPFSEIQCTTPLNDTQEDTLPPSYHDVTNPEASPPTYQSLYGQVREAQKNSNGLVDFFKNVIALLLGTIGCTVLLGVIIIIPLSMIIVGSIYLKECPVEPYIPIYLIVGGTFGVLKDLISFYSRFKKSLTGQEEVVYRSRDSILSCFLSIWFTAGCVWTYRVYEPEYEDTSSPLYCNRTLYLFTFWLLTSSFIIMGVMIILTICLVVWTIATALQK